MWYETLKNLALRLFAYLLNNLIEILKNLALKIIAQFRKIQKKEVLKNLALGAPVWFS